MLLYDVLTLATSVLCDFALVVFDILGGVLFCEVVGILIYASLLGSFVVVSTLSSLALV